MAPKKGSTRQPVVEAPPPEQEKPPPPPPPPKYDDKWFDDPIEGEEAIRMKLILQQKIEEKAAPVRTWLENNIVGLLLQALSALVAFRPSNPHEFLAAHLIKNNPLKETYAEDEPKPRKPLEEENIEPDDEYDPCGCDRFKKKEPPPVEEALTEPAKELSASQLAKKSAIAADAQKFSVPRDAVRASVLARAKAGSAKK